MKAKMKLLLVVLFIAGLSYGQSNKEDIDIIQARFGKEKKEIVKKFLSIPESQSEAFWTLYDQFEAERKVYGKDRIALIEDYAKSYSSIDNEKATELMNQKMALNDEYNKLQKKYFKKISKVIGANQATQLFQLEDYIENILRLSIQDEIPFINELELTKIK